MADTDLLLPSCDYSACVRCPVYVKVVGFLGINWSKHVFLCSALRLPVFGVPTMLPVPFAFVIQLFGRANPGLLRLTFVDATRLLLKMVPLRDLPIQMSFV